MGSPKGGGLSGGERAAGVEPTGQVCDEGDGAGRGAGVIENASDERAVFAVIAKVRTRIVLCPTVAESDDALGIITAPLIGAQKSPDQFRVGGEFGEEAVVPSDLAFPQTAGVGVLGLAVGLRAALAEAGEATAQGYLGEGGLRGGGVGQKGVPIEPHAVHELRGAAQGGEGLAVLVGGGEAQEAEQALAPGLLLVRPLPGLRRRASCHLMPPPCRRRRAGSVPVGPDAHLWQQSTIGRPDQLARGRGG